MIWCRLVILGGCGTGDGTVFRPMVLGGRGTGMAVTLPCPPEITIALA